MNKELRTKVISKYILREFILESSIHVRYARNSIQQRTLWKLISKSRARNICVGIVIFKQLAEVIWGNITRPNIPSKILRITCKNRWKFTSVCRAKYSKESYFQKHMEKHLIADQRSSPQIKREKNIDDDCVKYPCTECQKQFSAKSTLSNHIKVTHEGRKLQCKHCDHRSRSRTHLKKHYDSMHPEQDFDNEFRKRGEILYHCNITSFNCKKEI